MEHFSPVVGLDGILAPADYRDSLTISSFPCIRDNAKALSAPLSNPIVGWLTACGHQNSCCIISAIGSCCKMRAAPSRHVNTNNTTLLRGWRPLERAANLIWHEMTPANIAPSRTPDPVSSLQLPPPDSTALTATTPKRKGKSLPLVGFCCVLHVWYLASVSKTPRLPIRPPEKTRSASPPHSQRRSTDPHNPQQGFSLVCASPSVSLSVRPQGGSRSIPNLCKSRVPSGAVVPERMPRGILRARGHISQRGRRKGLAAGCCSSTAPRA